MAAAGPIGDHLAILIDADNISHRHIAGLLAEVAKYGTASVRRIYGDWTSPSMRSWSECLLAHSLMPIQQFPYTTGKNATDGAMIIDAMDLLYTGRFASFCLVSSDSDFTRLAARIRENGIKVYGFGNRHNTHRALIAACNEFVYLDALIASEEGAYATATQPPPEAPALPANRGVDTSRTTADLPHSFPAREFLPLRAPLSPDGPASSRVPPSRLPWSFEPEQRPRPLNEAAVYGICQAIQHANVYEDDYVNLAEVGHILTKLSPDLNSRNYGYSRLRGFVETSGIVQLRMKTRENAPPIALVRLNDN